MNEQKTVTMTLSPEQLGQALAQVIGQVDVKLTRRQVGRGIGAIISEMVGPVDDYGADWTTDGDGWTWLTTYDEAISRDPNIATLVDAMNIISLGHRLDADEERQVHEFAGTYDDPADESGGVAQDLAFDAHRENQVFGRGPFRD